MCGPGYVPMNYGAEFAEMFRIRDEIRRELFKAVGIPARLMSPMKAMRREDEITAENMAAFRKEARRIRT